MLGIKYIDIWKINSSGALIKSFNDIFENSITSINTNTDFDYKQYKSAFISECPYDFLKVVLSGKFEKNKKIIFHDKSGSNVLKFLEKEFIKKYSIAEWDKFNKLWKEKEKKFLKSLVFQKNIVVEGDKFISSKFKGKVLGIHARGGDARKRGLDNKTLPIKKSIELVKAIQNEYDIIYVSAEDEDQLKPFVEAFGEKVVSFPKKFLELRGDKIRELMQARVNTEATLIELYLLSKCSKLITPQISNFSYVAADIGGIERISISNS